MWTTVVMSCLFSLWYIPIYVNTNMSEYTWYAKFGDSLWLSKQEQSYQLLDEIEVTRAFSWRNGYFTFAIPYFHSFLCVWVIGKGEHVVLLDRPENLFVKSRCCVCSIQGLVNCMNKWDWFCNFILEISCVPRGTVCSIINYDRRQ